MAPLDRYGREVPPDNEPPPLLTYGEDEDEADRPPLPRPTPVRRRVPVWAWALAAVVVLGGAYLAATAVLDGAPSSGASGLTPLSSEPGSAGAGSTARGRLGPLVSTDTAVVPGSDLELAVRARDESGAPVSDARVRFEIDGPVGSLSEAEVWTDPSGVARSVLTLPDRPVEVEVRAVLEGSEAPATRFTVVARTGPPASIVPVDGDGQEADAGALLPERLAIVVRDATGRPVPGAEVRFEVATGGGLAAPSLARTDSLGRASAIWRLGPAAGPQTLAAATPQLPTVVTFSADARPVATATAQGAAPSGTQPPEAATEPGVPSAPPQGGGTPASTAPVTVQPRDFVVGGSNVCRLEGGAVTCRGANDRGQTVRSAAGGSRALAAGLFHVCALSPAGVASCWGANESGQLGDGSRTDRASPVRVETELRFSDLAAGVAHTCGLTGGGRAACWGENLGGQLGDGSRTERATPGLVASEVGFADLVAGWNHTCGLTGGGAVHCWGLNREGQVGDGSRLDRLTPQRVVTGVSALAAGNGHTCALSGDQVLCWGDNRFGQLGDGTTESRTRPTAVSELPGTPMGLVAGATHTCALLTDGSAWCWGQNLHGQLGDGTNENRSTPAEVSGSQVFTSLAAGGGVTCGVDRVGNEYCWGLNQSGQLGDGSLANRSVPTRVGGG